MANKRNREANLKAEREKRFRAACEKLKIYPVICVAMSVLTVLLFFVNFAEVYNTQVGTEVRISGFNTFFAAITGQYTKPEVIFGDMAVPFYRFAEDYTRMLGGFTVCTFLLTVLNLTVQMVAATRGKSELNAVSFSVGVLQTGFAVACFIIALSMKNAKILSDYCGNNPVCSIRSYAVFPAITALVATCVSAVAAVKYFSARRLIKG